MEFQLLNVNAAGTGLPLDLKTDTTNKTSRVFFINTILSRVLISTQLDFTACKKKYRVQKLQFWKTILSSWEKVTQ